MAKDFINQTIEEIRERLDNKHLMFCDAEHCVWNPNGICLCGVVTGSIPKITDEVDAGCTEYLWKE